MCYQDVAVCYQEETVCYQEVLGDVRLAVELWNAARQQMDLKQQLDMLTQGQNTLVSVYTSGLLYTLVLLYTLGLGYTLVSVYTLGLVYTLVCTLCYLLQLLS